jgi:hypothetical protein
MTPIFLPDFLKEANKILAPSLDVANYSALRIESLKVLILVLKKVPDCDPTTQSDLMENIREVNTNSNERTNERTTLQLFELKSFFAMFHLKLNREPMKPNV